MAAGPGTPGLTLDVSPKLSSHELSGNGYASNHPDSRRVQTTLKNQVFILLVDDNPADVLLVREALKWHEVNSEVIVARDGDDAIHLIDEIDTSRMPCPSLVILDLNLPRKTGFEVLERVRASAGCAEIPVVVLSSSDAISDRQKAKLLGASQYIQKPSNLQEFMSIGARLKDILASAHK
jgi:DNA-binding response OmpR family regulator